MECVEFMGLKFCRVCCQSREVLSSLKKEEPVQIQVEAGSITVKLVMSMKKEVPSVLFWCKILSIRDSHAKLLERQTITTAARTATMSTPWEIAKELLTKEIRAGRVQPTMKPSKVYIMQEQ